MANTTERFQVLSMLREIALIYGTDTAVNIPKYDAPTITAPEDIAKICSDMVTLPQEQLRVILLSTKLSVIDSHIVYQGTVDAAAIRVSEVLRPAIVANAPNMVLVHNHPSGDPTPSPDDQRMTKRVKDAADLMDIELKDHIVVAANLGGFVSLKERGLMD